MAATHNRAGEPDRQVDPDARLAKAFLVGCGVLLLAFLLLAVALWVIWTR